MLEISWFSVAIYILECITMMAGFYLLYFVYFVPLEAESTLEDGIGYRWIDPSGSKSTRKRKIENARRLRDVGHLPPPYPNGWYPLLQSSQVKPGDVVQVTLMAKQLCVFRSTTKDAKISIVDSYCPHLGANLCSGGSVEGSSIKCPFHDWKFSGETGNCTGVPNYQKAPVGPKVRVWRSLELNKTIFVWYHVDGIEPTYHPEHLKEVENGQWVYQGSNSYEVACHIQDIPENGADIAHLPAVHRESVAAGGEPLKNSLLSRLMSWGWHEWSVSWEADDGPGRDHLAKVRLRQKFRAMGKVTLLDLHVEGDQIGPSLVHLHFNFPGLGWRGVMMQYVEPLEPMLTKIVHVFYTERRWNPLFAKLVLKGESILLERDIAIWNSKRYQKEPSYATKEDGFIKKHRKWFEQFYSDNSLTYEDAKKVAKLYDW